MTEPPNAPKQLRALSATLIGLLAGLVVTLAGGDARAEHALAWTAPKHARLIAWSPDKPAAAALLEVNPNDPVAIPSGHVLLVPVNAGDRLEVQGDGVTVGLGSGALPAPDVITWLPTLNAPNAPNAKATKNSAREVLVPAWSAARFLAIRSATPANDASARIRIAAKTSAPLAWHRFDDDIAAWLVKDPSVGRPALDSPEASVIARRLEAIRRALGPVASTNPGEAWLMAKWLEASARVRPLVEPYFTRRNVSIEGGREAPELGEVEGVGGFVASVGGKGAASRLVLRAASGDVLRIVFRVHIRGPARVLVREGDFAARALNFSMDPRAPSAGTWTPPRWVRAVVPVESRTAMIEVLEGEVAVAAAAYRQRLSIDDWSAARRDRDLQLDRALDAAGESPGDRVIAELAAIDHSGSAAVARSSLARLQALHLSAPLQAVVDLETAWTRSSPAEVPEATARAFRAASALKPEIAAPLVRVLLERLATVHPDPVTAPMPWTGELAPIAKAGSEDSIAAATWAAVLSPPRDGRRPVSAPRAEAFAWTHGDWPDAMARAREAWRREAPFAALSPRSGTPMGRAVVSREDQAPRSSLRDDIRWARAEPGRAVEFEVPQPGRETIARIFVAREGKASAFTIRARAGDRSIEAWIREGATGSIEIPIPAGETWLRVTTSAPALIRADARIHRSSGSEPPAWPPGIPESLTAALPPVGEDPQEGHFTLGVYGLYSAGDFADEDISQPLSFSELGALANRELASDRVWAGLRAFARLRREGSPSFGGDLSVDVSPHGLIPGGFVHGRIAVQKPIGQPIAVGLRGAAGLFWSLPLFHSLALVPSGSFTLRRTDSSLAGDISPDRDIFTRYGDKHHRFATFAMRLHARPFVDNPIRLGPSIRLSPSFSGIDRFDIDIETDILAGRGFWPWIGFSWLTSYRPITVERPVSFVRNVATLSATLWTWIPFGHRFSLGSETSYIFDDAPSLESLASFESPSFAAVVFIQYDHTGSRGLRDLPPLKRPFQNRLEEDSGSGRIQRPREGFEPAWEVLP